MLKILKTRLLFLTMLFAGGVGVVSSWASALQEQGNAPQQSNVQEQGNAPIPLKVEELDMKQGNVFSSSSSSASSSSSSSSSMSLTDITEQEKKSISPLELSLQILRIHEGLFSCQVRKDLYLVMEKIEEQPGKDSRRTTNTAQFRYWEQFNRSQIIELEGLGRENAIGQEKGDALSDGITSFMRMLQTVQTGPVKHQVWIAYASRSNVQYAASAPYTDIEMSFSVGHDPQAPFSSHVGIARNILCKESTNKNIAMLLHSFAAMVIKSQPSKVKKEYMITVPLVFMRKLFMESLPEEAIAIGDNHDEIRIKQEIKDEQGAKAFLEILEKMKKASPPRIKWADDKETIFILQQKDGKDFILKKTDQYGWPMTENSWFLLNRPLFPRAELPYVVVDIDRLAGIKDWKME